MDITSLLEALQDFEKMGKQETIPLLEQFLCHVAKTGEPLLSWTEFKPYFMFKLESIMDSFHAAAPEQRLVDNPNVEHVTFEEMKNRILKIVDSYNGIPFTIQRLCELLTDPKRNYSGTGKFLRGLEKNVMVVSCLCTNAEKNGSTNANRMNGVMFQGNSGQYSESRNINGPSTPKPLNRSRLVLASAFSTNGLPESKESEPTTHKPEDPISDTSLSEEMEVSPNVRTKNKRQEDEEGVEQSDGGPEVKRLKCETEDRGPERPSEAPHPGTEEDAEDAFCETPAVSENEDGMSENQNTTSEDSAVDEQEASKTNSDSEPDAVKSSDKDEPAPSSDPSAGPSSGPSADPSSDPSADPSSDPSADPLSGPSSDPSADLTDCDADRSDGSETENKPEERD